MSGLFEEDGQVIWENEPKIMHGNCEKIIIKHLTGQNDSATMQLIKAKAL